MSFLTDLPRGIAESARTAVLLLRAGITSLVQHWALASFSLIAAFAVWVVIQDVENPRVRGIAPEPPAAAIPVRPVNVPSGFIVLESPTVRVEVEARQDVLPSLRAGDFAATVDVQGLEPGGTVSLPVRVEAKRTGVDIVRVVPDRVDITLIRAASKELPVEVNLTGGLPTGYVLAEPPTVDPPFVTVTGHPDLVANVTKVQLDVNLSGVREPTYVVEGELVPRSDTGAVQQVFLSSPRARATFKIEQRFSQRTLAVLPLLTGAPAPGYLVANVTVEPPAVQVSGPVDVVQGLSQLATEAIDLTNASSTITRSVRIVAPANVALARETVTVQVQVAPIRCGAEGGACAGATFVVAPSFTDLPQGVMVGPGAVFVTVQVLGPLSQLDDLTPASFTAAVSLAGLSPGTHTLRPSVTAPPGIQVVSVGTVTVTLVPVSGSGP